jgi:hypothetical protein
LSPSRGAPIGQTLRIPSYGFSFGRENRLKPERKRIAASGEQKSQRGFDPGLELATIGAHWLTRLPLVGAQILVVLLARSSSDKTRLIPPT